jgi:hypothetical protein
MTRKRPASRLTVFTLPHCNGLLAEDTTKTTSKASPVRVRLYVGSFNLSQPISGPVQPLGCGLFTFPKRHTVGTHHHPHPPNLSSLLFYSAVASLAADLIFSPPINRVAVVSSHRFPCLQAAWTLEHCPPHHIIGEPPALLCDDQPAPCVQSDNPTTRRASYSASVTPDRPEDSLDSPGESMLFPVQMVYLPGYRC